jgi:hypothetical protein
MPGMLGLRHDQTPARPVTTDEGARHSISLRVILRTTAETEAPPGPECNFCSVR